MDRENQTGDIRRPAPYRFGRHGGFDEEWGLHKGVSEWWYATGTINDEAGKMFSYQFTMLRIKAAFLRPYILMLALTDFTTGRHRYYQNITLKTSGITVTDCLLRFGNEITLEKGEQGMRLSIFRKDFSLELELENGKGAVWHCDDGFLQMGIPGERQTTMYYSYPNMPTRGTLTLDGATRRVSGKTWFDKQGGPYALLNPKTHWEWFSLRFFDNEEMMLFSFPQDDARDGTYIRADGGSERLNDYSITATEFVRPEGGELVYASAWTVETPGRKEERYTIKPLLDGQMNLGYYELLAGVYNASGILVGYCFVELLPGARNKKFSIKLFQKAEK
ncbi:MAG: carotenoid 1,2-hydratase [Clostridiaceae bacterium]